MAGRTTLEKEEMISTSSMVAVGNIPLVSKETMLSRRDIIPPLVLSGTFGRY